MKTLSIFPFYGGKARMASLICDMLNYDDSDTYIEMFGGGCRTLLNKPRHNKEIYIDTSDGLCSVVSVLSNKATAKMFIDELLKTEYSKAEFDNARETLNLVENDFEELKEQSLYSEMKKLMVHYGLVSANATKKHCNKKMIDDNIKKQLATLIENETPDKRKRIYDMIENKYDEYEKVYQSGAYVSITEDEIEKAVATYIVYMQSRSAMGEVWSSAKFKSTDDYHKRILNLYECAERLEGVKALPINSTWLLQGNSKKGDFELTTMAEKLNDPRVMMYCDPSYIDPKNEAKWLKGINWEVEPCLSDVVEKNPKNLGKTYCTSFNYKDHENFLRTIYNSKCKILVSNYDLILYNKYLSPTNGWKKHVFYTTTSAGGKKGSAREEILWYNY